MRTGLRTGEKRWRVKYGIVVLCVTDGLQCKSITNRGSCIKLCLQIVAMAIIYFEFMLRDPVLTKMRNRLPQVRTSVVF